MTNIRQFDDQYGNLICVKNTRLIYQYGILMMMMTNMASWYTNTAIWYVPKIPDWYTNTAFWWWWWWPILQVDIPIRQFDMCQKYQIDIPIWQFDDDDDLYCNLICAKNTRLIYHSAIWWWWWPILQVDIPIRQFDMCQKYQIDIPIRQFDDDDDQFDDDDDQYGKLICAKNTRLIYNTAIWCSIRQFDNWYGSLIINTAIR